MHKQQHVKCSHRLNKIAQTAQNKRAPDNDAIVAMTTLTSRNRLLLDFTAWHDFLRETTVTFLQISRKL